MEEFYFVFFNIIVDCRACFRVGDIWNFLVRIVNIELRCVYGVVRYFAVF